MSKDLRGRTFGRMRAIERIARGGRVYWRCACECGDIHTARTDHLLGGTAGACRKPPAFNLHAARRPFPLGS